MKRDWGPAREKVDRERACRSCGTTTAVQAAHIVPRSRVTRGGEDPRNIVPLCGLRCHPAYDTGGLDILGVLSREEQAYAVLLVGLAEAYQRTTNTRKAA
jgi:hypothetical protein